MLNLSGTFLGDENFVALCQVLSKCENLRELRLAHCKLKRKSAQVLVQQLRKNCWSHLEVLDVRNNLLSQKDLEILRHVSKTLSFTLLDDGNQLRDEVLNSVTHGVGFVSSIFAGSSLTFRAQILPPLERTGIYIYVLSLCLMFASSTLYHSFFRLAKAKRVFRALDHCSIFILIAGTYTPFVQKFLWYQRRILGFSILTTIWCLAFLGIFLSSGFLELHTFSNTLRVLLAVFMGWLVLGTSKILREEMPSACFYWVLTGGIFYTVGIPFYIKVKQQNLRGRQVDDSSLLFCVCLGPKDNIVSCLVASLAYDGSMLSLCCRGPICFGTFSYKLTLVGPVDVFWSNFFWFDCVQENIVLCIGIPVLYSLAPVITHRITKYGT